MFDGNGRPTAAGREGDFSARPFGIIQEAADRLGMGEAPKENES